MAQSNLATEINTLLTQQQKLLSITSGRMSQFFEVGTLLAVYKYYKHLGYITKIHDIRGVFRCKLTTRGYPADYSYVTAQDPSVPSQIFAIYQNVPIQTSSIAHAHLCVDVAVLRRPLNKARPRNWKFVSNSQMLTWVECKYLEIYPMMVAHFIGIIHELSPGHLSGASTSHPHLQPTLVSKGSLSPNLQLIINSFQSRNITANVRVPFDKILELNLVSNPHNLF